MVSLRLLATALAGFVPLVVAAVAADPVEPAHPKRTGIACDAWVDENNVAVDDCPEGMYCFESLDPGSDGICVNDDCNLNSAIHFTCKSSFDQSHTFNLR